MTMTDAERFDLICSPALKRIEDKIDGLHHTVAVSNGKPSVLARLDVLEKASTAAPSPAPVAPARVLKLGPLELTGYGLNDITRAVIVLGIIWLAVTNYIGQAKTQALIDAMKAAAQASQ